MQRYHHLRKSYCVPSFCPAGYISYLSQSCLYSDISPKKSLEDGSVYMPQGLLSSLLLASHDGLKSTLQVSLSLSLYRSVFPLRTHARLRVCFGKRSRFSLKHVQYTSPQHSGVEGKHPGIQISLWGWVVPFSPAPGGSHESIVIYRTRESANACGMLTRKTAIKLASLI